jgi:hypothetical protein
MVCAWFVDMLRQYYSLMMSDGEPRFHHWLGVVGGGAFALAWLWSLVTTVALWREAGRQERKRLV